jgi:hypothetical protein
VELSGVQEGDVVSVAVDRMAMNSNRSCLAAMPSDDMFVNCARPRARPKKCSGSHVFRDASGKTGPDVQRVLDDICKVLSDRNI